MTFIARALLALVHLVPAAAIAQQTRLWLLDQDGFQTTYATPSASIVVTPTLDRVSLQAQMSGAFSVFMEIAAPPGGQLGVGAYEESRRYPFNGNAPGLSISVPYFCSDARSRFSVLEWVVSNGQVVSFAINFETVCSAEISSWGELRYNSTYPLMVEKPAGATVPDPFAFKAQRWQPPGAAVKSNETGIWGINQPSPISITGGQYSINGGAFTSAAGTVQLGDRLQLSATAPTTPGALHRATVTIGGRSANFDLTTYAPGEVITGWRYRSTPGDWVGGGQSLEGHAPGWTFAQGDQGRGPFFMIKGDEGSSFTLNLHAPEGQALQLGVYENASSYRSYLPAVSLFGNGRGCTSTGRFVVLDIAMGANNTLDRFAANFEQVCENSAGAVLIGEIRINTQVPFSHLNAANDSTPDPFALSAPGPVRGGSTVLSNKTRVTGIRTPAAISIVGGEYSVNGGAFTASPGQANDGDQLQVRLVASGTAGATNNATLTVGGVSATLSVQTYAPGMVLTGFYFRSPPGEPLGQGKVGLFLAPFTKVYQGPAFSAGNADIRVEPADSPNHNAVFRAPNDGPLSPGDYTNAGRFSTATNPGLDVTLNQNACSGQVGNFVVHEIAYKQDGTLERFAADFSQYCNSNYTVPPLYGEVRFNSQVPFRVLLGSECGAGDSDGDGMADCVELAQGTNPDVKDNDVFNSARLFAMQQYRDFLAREADDGGLTYWTGRLQGGLSRYGMIEQFLNSPEFGGTIAPLARLYFAYFLRIPDYGGMTFWTDYVKQGNPLATVSNLFAGSSEFQQAYGSLDNPAFVDRIYRNVLGRAPDSGGLAHWTNQLNTNQMTRGQVMLAFSESPEYRDLMTSEIAVTMTYMGMMRRAPDAGGYAFWVDYLDDGNSVTALVDGFLRSTEYRKRFLP